MKNGKLIPWITILFTAFLVMSCTGNRTKVVSQEDRIIGVKIYDHHGSFPELFEEWRSLGINTAFVSASLDSNAEFRSLAKKYNIATYIILPIFYNPEELQRRPELFAITAEGKKASEEWVSFVCPTRQDYRQDRIRYISNLIKELEPDGISIDFIRHFVFWEKVYPDRHPEAIPNTCFDTYCLQIFQTDRSIDIPDSLEQIPEIAAWIRNNYLAEWTEWKCELITNMIGDIVDAAREIKPGININVHAVPWRQNDFGNAIKVVAGQDFSKIATHVDIISPMTYAHMVKQKPEWVNSVVRDIAGIAKCRVVPSIQVNEAYLTEPLTVAEFEKSLIAALEEPSSGVIFWSWEQLDKRPEKKVIVRSVLNK